MRRVVVLDDEKPLTSGQVARICGCAPRTVTQWFKKGLIRGYRIPGSDDRRIPLPCLLEFLRANGLPVPDGLESRVILSYGLRAGEAVPGAAHCPTLVDLGIALATRAVSGVVVGDADGGAAACGAVAAVRQRHAYANVVLVAGEDWPADRAACADFVVRRPCDWSEVLAALAAPRATAVQPGEPKLKRRGRPPKERGT